MEFIDAKKYKRQIKNLYKSAFPKEERAPLFLLFKKAEAGKALFYAVLEDNEFIGLVYIITTKKLAYIFFLAVEEENRSKGYGSKILESVKKMYPEKTVILEIEDTEKEDAENISERLKRLEFYERNGFVRLHHKVNEAGVDFELLGTDNTVNLAEFLELMKNYLGRFLFKIIYIKDKNRLK